MDYLYIYLYNVKIKLKYLKFFNFQMEFQKLFQSYYILQGHPPNSPKNLVIQILNLAIFIKHSIFYNLDFKYIIKQYYKTQYK